MGLRKAAAYSRMHVRPYTRKSGVKSKSYIKAIPQNKIVKFRMGNQKDSESGKHKFIIKYMSEEKVQIRDNALEASRMWLNKILDEKMPGEYFLDVKVYPHHIQRENKSAGGMAGADRISTGMTHSFGITIGRAAIVNAGKDVFVITTTSEKNARDARDALKDVKTKLPCRGRIIFEKLE